MKRWVLMGGWRDALYLNEPSRKNVSISLLGYYCDVLEGIAWVSSVTLWGNKLCIYLSHILLGAPMPSLLQSTEPNSTDPDIESGLNLET